MTTVTTAPTTIAIVTVTAAQAAAALRPVGSRPAIQRCLAALAGCPAIAAVHLRTADVAVAAVAAQVPLVAVQRDALEIDPVAAMRSTAAAAGAWSRLVLAASDSALLESGQVAQVLTALDGGAPAAVSAVATGRLRGPDGRRGAGEALAEDGALVALSRSAWERDDPAAIAVPVALDLPGARWNGDPLALPGLAAAAQERRLAGVRLVVCDVDGTLTDGGMYYGGEGEALKRFDTRDAHGLIGLRKRFGIELGIITAEDSPSVRARCAKLGIGRVAHGCKDKVPMLRAWCAELGLTATQVAYVGDDDGDLGCLHLAGVAAAPADAVSEVSAICEVRLSRRGGRGAVRELCDRIRAARPG